MLYLNDQPLNVTVFPDNTSQVWKLPESTFQSNKAKVRWDYSNEAEVMHLFQLLHLFEVKNISTHLTIDYLPYARQDKPVSNDSTFALSTFFLLLNNFRSLRKITVVDPHNFDAVRPPCAVEAIYPAKKLVEAIQELKPDVLCYPDKGAVKKYSELPIYKYHSFIYGEKVRDQLTGNITSYKVIGDPAGKNVLIVDDICDGGMTFKLLATDLLAAGATEVNLFVTHGIFSRGVRTLKESGIKRVFTKDGEVSPRSGSIQL